MSSSFSQTRVGALIAVGAAWNALNTASAATLHPAGAEPGTEQSTRGGSYAFGSDMSLSWTSDGTNITFSLACYPSSSKGTLSWCAFGINRDGSDKMYPAEAFWAGIDSTGAPYLDDRIISKDAMPPCAATQLSLLTASSLSPSGTLVVNFTRPLAINSALSAQGYTAITNSKAAIIAAIGTGPRQETTCDTVEVEHYNHYHKISINFLQ
jgi:hypothetical protein